MNKAYEQEKKLVALELSREAVYRAIIEAAPDLPFGVRLVDAFEDPWTKNIYVLVQHPSFHAVPEGMKIPLWSGSVLLEKDIVGKG